MTETRKLAAILAADVVGYSRLAGADEDRILARLRALRSDVIDPTIAVNRGRVVKRTGDGAIVEFRSVVDAVRCATEIQNAMIERNSGLPDDQRIVFRIGIHVGDVVEEADGDLMGDGVNIAARLEGVAKPGAICLSEQAYWQVKGRLDFAVTDLGPTQLKNIAEPVRAYLLEVGVPGRAKPASGAKRSGPNKRSALAPLVAAIAALFVAIAGGAWYFLVASRPVAIVAGGPEAIATNTPAIAPSPPPVAKHFSIVVLPFTNLSNDPSQDYFADGITDNLTTDLSRIRGSFVIARTTAFTFKGKSVDAKEIGRELGVRYVLEGSVQREQNHVRVNTQLVDAETGAHLWADRFEEDVTDLFKLQDQVVARLANELGYQLVRAEAEKSARTQNPDALDLTLRGRALIYQWGMSPKTNTKDKFDAALVLFDKALEIDRDNVGALSSEALIYALELARSSYENFGLANIDLNAKSLGQANRALLLDPDNTTAYAAKSTYLTSSGHPREGLEAAEAGLAINPNATFLYASRAYAHMTLRRYEEVKTDVQLAMQLSPRDFYPGHWNALLGAAELALGNFEAAENAYRKSIDLGWREPNSYMGLVAIYALQDKIPEMNAALDEARRVYPELTTVKRVYPRVWNLPNLFEGLSKAGLPYK